MPESWEFTFLLLIAIVILGWFALGTGQNVRKGNAALRWLQSGLPLLGERTTMRWLGSSVVELKIAKGKLPFRNVETLVVLEPRDVPLLWAFARAQGRRDLLIVRAQLESAPPFELEAFDPKGWTTHSTERDVQKKNWTRLELGAESALHAFHSGGAGTRVKSLIDQATRAGAPLVRLSLHRTVPNLEVHYQLPELAAHPARDLFQRVRQIAEEVTR